jgi:ubiquinone/menaquinone biosynthesis methyltransferase
MTGEANAAEFDPVADDVFSRIAGRYDRLCDAFSLFAHRLWKSRIAELMAREEAGAALDVASGTGDIPLRLLRRRPHQQILVTDICPQMLSRAEQKLEARSNVKFRLLDAHHLDLPDQCVDLYSISFGMKICHRARVVSEAYRVLRPGGTFFCLEAARIPFEPLHRAYLAYMDWCLPFIARVATGGDASAYNYLLRGIHDFPNQQMFAAELEQQGFKEVSFQNLTFGIVAIHRGVKPN